MRRWAHQCCRTRTTASLPALGTRAAPRGFLLQRREREGFESGERVKEKGIRGRKERCSRGVLVRWATPTRWNSGAAPGGDGSERNRGGDGVLLARSIREREKAAEAGRIGWWRRGTLAGATLGHQAGGAIALLLSRRYGRKRETSEEEMGSGREMDRGYVRAWVAAITGAREGAWEMG